MRSIHKNVPVHFQPYDWIIKETEWTKENSRNHETIFTVANGYLGIRGFFEESFPHEDMYEDRTTMINGIYEYHKYNHIWCRPGFPERFHAIVGQANPFDVASRRLRAHFRYASGHAHAYLRLYDEIWCESEMYVRAFRFARR